MGGGNTPTASKGAASPAGGKITIAKKPEDLIDLAPGPGHYPVHDSGELYHCGKPHVIQMLTDFSVKWAELRAKAPFSNRPGSFRFGLGDIFAPTGHKSHHDGLSVDIFMFRNDGLEQRMLVHGSNKVHLFDKTGTQTTKAKVSIAANMQIGGGDHASYDRAITVDLIQCFIEHCGIPDENVDPDPAKDQARLDRNKLANLERIIINDKHIIKYFQQDYRQKLGERQINNDDVLNPPTIHPDGRVEIHQVHHDHVHFRFF